MVTLFMGTLFMAKYLAKLSTVATKKAENIPKYV